MSWEWNDRTELYHHGILGMKWGVRRYQNPDGSLTADGRKRYSSVSSADEFNNRVRQESINKKVSVGKDYDIIKKGTEIGRFANKIKEDDSRAKYAYVTDMDRGLYSEYALNGMLWAKGNKFYEHTMESIKDIKVAKGYDVADYIIEKYGNTPLKTIYSEEKAIDTRSNFNKLYGMKSGNDRVDKIISDRILNGHKAVINALSMGMKDTKISDDVFKEFSKRGYDAIVDPEDFLTGVDYPIILLNPKESTKIKSVK